MTKLLTIPRFYGPLFTVLATVAYHYLAGIFGYSISGSLLFIILAFGTFAGGLRAGLICTVWITIYTFYAFPGDPGRIIQISLGAVAISLVIGWQTKKLREFYKVSDELLNGNVARLNEALQSLRLAKAKNVEARKLMEASENAFGNVLGGMVGYTQLRQSIREVEKWYADPENVRRLQAMDNLSPRERPGGREAQ